MPAETLPTCRCHRQVKTVGWCTYIVGNDIPGRVPSELHAHAACLAADILVEEVANDAALVDVPPVYAGLPCIDVVVDHVEL